MKKFVLSAVFALLCALLVSCGQRGAAPRPASPDGSLAAAESYSLTVTDGRRSVTVAVSRNGECSTATVTAPAELAGVSVVSDVSGCRIAAYGASAALSPEAAAWVTEMLSVTEKDLTDADVTAELIDGVSEYSYRDGDFDVKVRLGADGVPSEFALTRNGVTRKVRVEH